MKEVVYGRNPVYECLRAGRRDVFTLLLADGVKRADRVAEIEQLARSRKAVVRQVQRDQLEKIAEGSQGVVLEVSGYPYVGLDRVFRKAEDAGEPPFLLILDALQDPQNLGSLVRTAEAVGVHGVMLPPRQAARVTPAVVSASSGAVEHMLVVQGNLAASIRELKERDLWVVGLDHGERCLPPEKVDLSGPIALVVGSEGQGLRRLVRDSCDFLMRLPMVGQVESLNAAIAGSIALYMTFRTRTGLQG